VESDLVMAWLRKTLRAASAWQLVGIVGCLSTGLVVLFVSFWVSYGVLWFISASFLPLPRPVILLIAAGFMGLVVAVGVKQNRESLEPLPRQVSLAREMDITLTPWTRYGMSYNTNAVKAGAFEIRSLASVINYILCGGVLLLLASLRKLRHFRRLKQVDLAGCSRVITLLYGAARRQSFSEIVERLPGLNPVKVFDDLRCIDGVLFLSNEPAGLITLHPDLRGELERLPSSV
jgi:hypothetical protein